MPIKPRNREDVSALIEDARSFALTDLWTAMCEQWTDELARHERALHNPKTPIDEIRAAQGACLALTRVRLVLEDIARQAARALAGADSSSGDSPQERV